MRGKGNQVAAFLSFAQVFISGTKSECRKLLQTILKNRRLCSLLSPFFTPNAAPAEFIQLYENVVKCLSEDNSDVIFMLLTKVLTSRLGSTEMAAASLTESHGDWPRVPYTLHDL